MLLFDRSRLRSFGDNETKLSNVACEAEVRPHPDSDSSVSPMLRHSAIMPRPSSPTGLLLRIMTCRSCVSAAPLSRKSSMECSVKPMSSKYIVRILECSIALPMCGAPLGSMRFPDKFISSRLSHCRIMSPMATAACSHSIPLQAMWTDLRLRLLAAPWQNWMAPSLPSLLLFSEMFLSISWFSSNSEKVSAAFPSMEQLSKCSWASLGNFMAARQTTSAPSEPISLLLRQSNSILVVLSISTARQPAGPRLMLSARSTLK
mmetsp:Transcript_81772/g.210591  ORF Transcript_81772/g.210591 Transcript_81772/m.210591 type:complete len:261 (-) Transcript_81772:1774-2556(-)